MAKKTLPVTSAQPPYPAPQMEQWRKQFKTWETLLNGYGTLQKYLLSGPVKKSLQKWADKVANSTGRSLARKARAEANACLLARVQAEALIGSLSTDVFFQFPFALPFVPGLPIKATGWQQADLAGQLRLSSAFSYAHTDLPIENFPDLLQAWAQALSLRARLLHGQDPAPKQALLPENSLLVGSCLLPFVQTAHEALDGILPPLSISTSEWMEWWIWQSGFRGTFPQVRCLLSTPELGLPPCSETTQGALFGPADEQPGAAALHQSPPPLIVAYLPEGNDGVQLATWMLQYADTFAEGKHPELLTLCSQTVAESPGFARFRERLSALYGTIWWEPSAPNPHSSWAVLMARPAQKHQGICLLPGSGKHAEASFRKAPYHIWRAELEEGYPHWPLLFAGQDHAEPAWLPAPAPPEAGAAVFHTLPPTDYDDLLPACMFPFAEGFARFRQPVADGLYLMIKRHSAGLLAVSSHLPFAGPAFSDPHTLFFAPEKSAVPTIHPALLERFAHQWETENLAKGAEALVQNNPALRQCIQEMTTYSRNLPVLHKFTLQAFRLLPRNEAHPLPEKDAPEMQRVLESYRQKVQQLGKDAIERRKIFQSVEGLIAQALGLLRAPDASLLATETLPAKAYSYLLGVLNHPAYSALAIRHTPYDALRIPLTRNVQAMSAAGERLLHMRPAPSETLQWEEIETEAGIQKPRGLSFNSEGHCLEMGTVRLKIPLSLADMEWMGQPLPLWIAATLKRRAYSGFPAKWKAEAACQMLSYCQALSEWRKHVPPLLY